MKLVDTSSWIRQMRDQGDRVVRARVEALLRAGGAAWCAMARLEIRAGIGNECAQQTLRFTQPWLSTGPSTPACGGRPATWQGRTRRAG